MRGDVFKSPVHHFDGTLPRLCCNSSLKFLESAEVAVHGDGFFCSNRGIEKLAMTGADKEDDFVGEVVEFAKIFGE